MFVSFAAIGLNFCLNYFFIFQFGLGHRGLALATSLSAAANFLTLYLLMHRNAQTLETGRFLSSIARCGLASAALGLACWLGANRGASWLDGPSLWSKVAALFAIILCAGSVYLIVCFVLRVEEVTTSWRLLTTKFPRRAR